MIYSAGVIIHNGESILGCVPFGRKNLLDIPKGQLKENEEPINAAIRETKEETGIALSRSNLKYLGLYDYIKNKKLHLFSAFDNFDLNQLYCSSTFDYNGKQVPEMIGYKLINIKDTYLMYQYFYPSLSKILIPLIKENLWQ